MATVTLPFISILLARLILPFTEYYTGMLVVKLKLHYTEY